MLLLLTAGRLGAQMSANGVLYVNTYKVLAMNEMQRSGIPAAIILAQGLHETEAGTSELVKQSNNHFGIKCKDEWKGEVVYHDDDSKQECFRSYPTAADSYRDHSDFLRRGTRYAFLFELDPTDYEGWAYGLRKAGYATNIKYSQILIKLVKDYNLQQYSLIAMGKMKAEDEVVLSMPGVPDVAAIGGKLGDGSTGIVSGAAGGTGGAAGGQSGVVDTVVAAAGSEPAVSYPEGEFMINKTRVVYARGGVSLLAIAGQYDIPLGRLLEFNDMKEQDVLSKGAADLFAAEAADRRGGVSRGAGGGESLRYQ